MVREHGLLRDPQNGEHGLDDLLEDDGAEDLGAADGVARGDLRRVVDAAADEPGRAGAVEEVEEACHEPVGGHGQEDGEERVGEGGEERWRGRVVDWVGVEERVLLWGAAQGGAGDVVAGEHDGVTVARP